MFSLKSLYEQDFERLKKHPRYSALTEDSIKKSMSSLNYNSDPLIDRRALLVDLPRTHYHHSLNIKTFCNQWLNLRNIKYIQGMSDGGCPSLLTCYAYLSAMEDLEEDLPQLFVIRFVYLDKDGHMSTFCFYAEYIACIWCVAVCHDPIKPPFELRFNQVSSTESNAFERLSEIINNEDITQKIKGFIDENFNSEEFTKRLTSNFVPVNFNLQGFAFDVLNEDEFKQHFERLKFKDVDIQKFNINLAEAIDRFREFNVENDIKLNLSYTTDEGQSAKFYFYFNSSNQQYLLALSDDTNSDIFCYSSQQSRTLPDKKTLMEFIQNQQICDATEALLIELKKLKSVPPEEVLDSDYPELNFFDTIRQCLSNLGLFFIRIMHSIADFFIALFFENDLVQSNAISR